MTNWKVPYVNYKVQWQQIGKEILSEIERVCSNGRVILVEDVERFEQNLADFLGVKYAIGVNSCTDAMRLALKVSGIRKDEYVITSSHTFLATLDAIKDIGANPVLVDSGIDGNMDTKLLKTAEPRYYGVGIMPVHLNGRMCNMDNIVAFAQKHKTIIIEDAAQALGATYKGKKAGSYGLGCFSFFPAKILGTPGDGGAVVTDNEEWAIQLRAMRDYGRLKGEEQVRCYGYNTRLDNLHAAILNVKFKYLPQWIERRRSIARHYNLRLSVLMPPRKLPVPPDADKDYYDVYQNYVIRLDADKRENFLRHMEDNGVECLVHWRTPLNKQKALGLEHYHLPVTEDICSEVVSLPMYPELTDEQVDYICDVIQKYFRR